MPEGFFIRFTALSALSIATFLYFYWYGKYPTTKLEAVNLVMLPLGLCMTNIFPTFLLLSGSYFSFAVLILIKNGIAVIKANKDFTETDLARGETSAAGYAWGEWVGLMLVGGLFMAGELLKSMGGTPHSIDCGIYGTGC